MIRLVREMDGVWIEGTTRGLVRSDIFLGSKITVDGDCSHEIKRPNYLEEKLGQM